MSPRRPRGPLASSQDDERAGLRILQLGLETPDTRPGGLNRYFADLCSALDDLGLDIRAVTAGTGSRGVALGWWTLSCPADRPLPVRLLEQWRTIRGIGGVDLVDSHFALGDCLPGWLSGLRRTARVVHFHGPWADESRLAGSSPLACWAKWRIERVVYRRADALVVLSHAFRRVLVERYGVSPWDVSVLSPGVDLQRFHPGERLAVRERLGVHPDSWVAVSVRRLVPRMGLDVLLEAWARLAQDAPGPFELVLVGDGPARPALEKRAAELGVNASVRFAGRVNDADLVDWYRAADVSVVPSVALEGFGLVALESLASGTPVVASRVGGLPEALRGMSDSMLVEPGDVNQLAERLTRVRMGVEPLPDADACRAHAERYSWAAVAERHADLYRGVAGGAPQSPPLRVVVLGHTAQLSGGELAMARLLGAMDGDAVVTHVILAEDGPLVGLLEQAGISVEVLPMDERSRHLPRTKVAGRELPIGAVISAGGYVERLTRRLRTVRPDLVHTNTLKAALYGGVAARVCGVPALWHVRDRIEDDYLPRPAVRLVRHAARVLPSAVIANSTSTLSSLHLPPGRGSVVPSPVDVHVRGGVARGVDADAPLTVGMVGRLAPWKGQDVFLRAFARTFPCGAETAVVVGSAMFGEGEFEASLRALVNELGVGHRVEFRGFRADVGSELARFDVLVHASVIPEPFGQVVVEGMAAGLPVVAAAAGGPAEVITDGVDGLLSPPGDVAALARQLRRLATDGALRRRLGDAGRRTANGYRPEAVARRVLDVYEDVLRHDRGQPPPRRHRHRGR